MSSHSMMYLAAAHAILNHPYFKGTFQTDYKSAFKLSSKIALRRLEELGSPLASTLLKTESSRVPVINTLADTMWRIHSGTLDPEESEWLKRHAAALDSFQDQLKKGRGFKDRQVQAFRAVLASGPLQKASSNSDSEFDEHFALRTAYRKLVAGPQIAPMDRIRESFEQIGKIADTGRLNQDLIEMLRNHAVQTETLEHNIKNLLRSNPGLVTILKKEYGRGILIDPRIIVSPKVDSWAPLLRDAHDFYAPSGEAFTLNHLWDLLHYGAHYGHLPSIDVVGTYQPNARFFVSTNPYSEKLKEKSPAEFLENYAVNQMMKNLVELRNQLRRQPPFQQTQSVFLKRLQDVSASPESVKQFIDHRFRR